MAAILPVWWRNQMEKFSASLAFCAWNSPVTGQFPSQRPVTRSFGVFFDLRLNKRWRKQSRRRWFQTPPCSLWRHCKGMLYTYQAFFHGDFVNTEHVVSVVGGVAMTREIATRTRQGVIAVDVAEIIAISCRKKGIIITRWRHDFPHYWPFVWETVIDHRRSPLTNGQ